MRIFIDESGTFTRAASGPSVSVVGALVLPDYRWPRIQRKYSELRQHLPQLAGEVKGRRLSEQQVGEVVALLRSNDALFEAAAIDLSWQSRKEVADHQMNQARRITASLTPRHQPGLRTELQGLRARLESLTPQLYVQSVMMFELIHRMLRDATLFFSQRQPKELGAFHWEIDGKLKVGVTDWEDWWTKVALPILQSKSQHDPSPQLVEGNYSYMKRFERTLPDWVERPAIAKGREAPALDLRLILMEDFRFCGEATPGLELVDILVNGVRRALVGNLKPEGFAPIATLMTNYGAQCLHLLALARDRASRRRSQYDATVRKYFSRGGRSILLRPR